MAASALAPGRAPVLADHIASTRVRQVVLVAGYALAAAAAANVAFSVPFSPVPITLQTFVVLLGAAALGPSRATAGMALYLGLGVLGVPVFAVTGGATLGYLLGFAAAAALVGAGARRCGDRTVARAAVLMVVGNVVIYVTGVAGLLLVMPFGIEEALMAGVVPFLAGDAIKIAAAAALLPSAWRMVRRVD